MAVNVFPGQGSQFLGMGRERFDDFPDLTRQADDILGFSIRELCLEDPERRLNKTRYTQPALYVVSAMEYFSHLRSGAPAPTYAAGHSLGEYNALLAAGAFDFETGLRLVDKRAQLMGEARGGGMAAVLGKSEQEVRDILAGAHIEDIDIANLNSASQIVVSGKAERIQEIAGVFDEAGCRYVQLNVTGAFHSRYMADAQAEFGAFVEQVTFRPLAFPVISNVTARPYQEAALREGLVAQIVSPVRWYDTIRYLLAVGETDFVQVGPGDVLTGLQRQIMRDHEPLVLDDEDDAAGAGHPSPAFPSSTPASGSRAGDEPHDHAAAGGPGASAVPGERPTHADRRGQEALRTPAIHVRSQSPTRRPALGSMSFMDGYSLTYPVVIGGMQRGISSTTLVTRAARAGLLSFYGTASQTATQVSEAVDELSRALTAGEPFGVNLVGHPMGHDFENDVVEICLRAGVRNLEVAGYIDVTPALVRFRVSGLRRGPRGSLIAPNRIIGKLSRPEAATFFLQPPPHKIVEDLRRRRLISDEEATLAATIPMAADLAVESDSAGYSDRGVASALLPTVQRLRDDAVAAHGYHDPVHVGACGGIGTPTAVAAAFMMGADFVVTGSINQCTIEAGTSDRVKTMLQGANIQDTAYVPSGELFEYGAERQVLRKGVLFPARARRVHELYTRHSGLADIDPEVRGQLEKRFFKRAVHEVLEECRTAPRTVVDRDLDSDPKREMAAVFRWYLDEAERAALSGSDEWSVDYQVPCSQALGAFNQWVKGGDLENWGARHVDEINVRLVSEAETYLRTWCRNFAARVGEAT